jgi:proton-translocating NADH-quinone oxidoreductase chain M
MLLNPLILLPLILFVGSFLLIFIPKNNVNFIKNFALFISLFVFLYSLLLWINFDYSCTKYQFSTNFIWISSSNINFSLGLDGVSLFFIVLTTFIFPLCILSSHISIRKFVKEYFIAFLLLELILIITFSVVDILLFYIAFESVLIPMFIIIGIWGSRERKIRAAYMFFMYTLFGSVLFLLAIIYIYNRFGTTDYETLILVDFSLLEQQTLWLAFFLSFAAKIPMVPFHIWLPEAHVEAPTAGSVVLAGLLLKLGSYGFVRFSLPLFPEACVFYVPVIFTISIVGVIYTSFTAIRQTDLKRIIAYTSVAHMNLIVMGIFSFSVTGLEGAILQSISHGFVSSALFLLIGVVYDRHHTRLVKYYSGVVHTMPLFTVFFLFFTMANIAVPGTSSFVGEFLILAGVIKINSSAAFLGATGMVLSGGYALWLFNRISYGNLKTQYLTYFSDLNKREFFVFLPLITATLFFGVYPIVLLDPIHASIYHVITQLNPLLFY